MFYITIITLGKLKNSWLQKAEKEFLKRISSFAKIKIIELKEISFSKKDKAENIKKEESILLQKHIPKQDFVIALEEKGKQFDSISFAKKISKLTSNGKHITFIIGGPLGIDSNLVKKCDMTVSLSPMTFTHQMTRVILLEQLYRSITIIKGKPYHY